MSAPERIWAWPWEVNPTMGQWETERSIVGEGTEYIRADLVRALVEALRDLMAIVEDARADEDVDAMDPGGAWLCGDEMHLRMGAARAALIAIEESKP